MKRVDVLILGGGLVGLTTALGLARHGVSCVVVDPADPVLTMAPDFDGRVTAIASATWRMFEALDLAPVLAKHACPIARIEVRDGPQRRALDFTPGDGEPLGMMVENRRLRLALSAASRDMPLLDLHAPASATHIDRRADGVFATLSDGTRVRADVMLACEGRGSPTREAAGFRSARWNYGHHAVISAIDHSLSHHNIAHEIFYPDGPFALLPMQPGNRSALVWSVPERQGPAVLAMGDAMFRDAIQKLSCGVVGEIGAMTARSSYPLSFHHTAAMVAERLALVGDSAHGIHPIAGQGLNLGMRDVAAIIEVLVDGSRLGMDLGDAQLLARYQQWRSFDSVTVAGATDLFTRLFGVPGRGVRAVRRFGLAATQRITPLKSLFMAEARGQTGHLPKLLQGLTV